VRLSHVSLNVVIVPNTAQKLVPNNSQSDRATCRYRSGLNSYSKQHALYRALKAFGQIPKSLFILQVIDDPVLRCDLVSFSTPWLTLKQTEKGTKESKPN
jgi:hypothetical protein